MSLPIEKLQKFFKLEAERGYDNRAVVGGLQKIVPSWEIESREHHLDDDFIQDITNRLNDYEQLDADRRKESIAQMLEMLKNVPIVSPFEAKQSILPPRRGRQEDNRPPRPGAWQPPSGGESQPRRFERKEAPPTPPRPDRTETAGLESPLTVISGIGPGYAQKLRPLGLNTLGDLLYYFPRRYDDYSQLKPINRLQYGEELTVMGVVENVQTRTVRSNFQITEAALGDTTGILRLTWFNQPWIANNLPAGAPVIVSGKVDMYLGRLVMNNPEWEKLDREQLNTNRIVPVYPLTAHVTQHWLRRIIFQAVSYWAQRVPEFIPDGVRQSARLLDLGVALQQAHFPDSQEQLAAARERLAFDEIFLLQLGVLRQKRAWQSGEARVFTADETWFTGQVSRLPYALTGAQQRVIETIRGDLASGKPMNRLLQGDVGSGKTVVAALAAAIVVARGAQAAFLAPTSILAEQHFRSLSNLFCSASEAVEPLLKDGELRLLVGDTSEADKTEIRNGLKDGSIKVIVGTHALLEDPVAFNALQLAVIDEQHRFGVNQRAALRSKGNNPHLLVMTATPIPRSLALTVYGDLDLSVMDEMPAGRQPIETFVLHPFDRERAYQLIRSEINKGHQAFIIYPLVELGERDEGKAAVDEHARLQAEVFTHNNLGLLHGRLRPEEKDAVMNRFRSGEYQVLVSTSVVEVGVDVPNATVMLIEGANRFGLAQLHQFRGRVGRGQEKSTCLLIPETEDALENERLAAMAETNDGFVLAERDLEQRGPGDFLGTRQAGFAELQMASLTDVRLIEKARQQAQDVYNQDPDFAEPRHKELARVFNRFWGAGRGDLS